MPESTPPSRHKSVARTPPLCPICKTSRASLHSVGDEVRPAAAQPAFPPLYLVQNRTAILLQPSRHPNLTHLPHFCPPSFAGCGIAGATRGRLRSVLGMSSS